ncbi:MAG: hypothetical protein HN712_27790 [Gemmatimonadetes bacterium]|jgi:uroporphyrinogen decarboxylase|nr:hypothetical protein [Gemmatimonadota bacterium]MBT6147722.1 hypothetical protein [Gemmatimonadota bacterium]MBT7864145.1 hypothetical protein [Gemmatimonadota bacterium]
MGVMTNRERMRAAIGRRPIDRLPINDSFWDETLTAWQDAGHMPRGVSARDFFDFEWQLVHFDAGFGFEAGDIETHATHVVRRDAYGAIGRFQKGRSAPAEMLEYPVKTRADWDQLKDRLHWTPERFGLHGFYAFTPYWRPPETDWQTKASAYAGLRDSQDYIALYVYDAFEATWRRMGHERALVALLEDPAWMREMFEAQIDLLIEGYQGMIDLGIVVDGFFMASDLALKTGPMFSPRLHCELCCPALSRLVRFLHANDVQIIFHCDGDFRPLIGNLIEAGVDCIQPLEVHAGMDVRELKRDYGEHLAFMGNIGHDEMLLPDAEMQALITDKVTSAARGGGYLYHSDHSVAPDIPFAQYVKVLDMVRSVVV